MKYWFITVSEDVYLIEEDFSFKEIAWSSHKNMEIGDEVFFFRIKGKDIKRKKDEKYSGIVARGQIIFKGEKEEIKKNYEGALRGYLRRNPAQEQEQAKPRTTIIVKLNKSFDSLPKNAVIPVD